MAQYTFDTLLDFEFANIALPSGYTKLNYIENTANNYILLPYKANNNTSVKIAFSLNSLSGDVVPYGCDHWYNYRNSGYIVFLENGNICVDYGNQRLNSNINASPNTFYSIEESPNGFFVNDVQKLSFNTQTFTCTNDFCLFTFGAVQSGLLNGKIKIVQISDDNISYNLIPCSYNGDIGMYDTIGGTFYGNIGTGTFISGGEAQTQNYQNGDEIIISSTKTHYHYEDGDLVFWYQEAEPLVFKGFSFEQTDYWQIPESVFRGFSFEIVYKKGGSALWHGMV